MRNLAGNPTGETNERLTPSGPSSTRVVRVTIIWGLDVVRIGTRREAGPLKFAQRWLMAVRIIPGGLARAGVEPTTYRLEAVNIH